MARILFFLILPTLFAYSAYSDVPGFVSIDCGSSSSLTYTNENSIEWMGDGTLVQNGQSEVVQNSNGVSQVKSTLRVFTTRKKNCYSIKADKGGQFLVRASFFYGNYDEQYAPPTFDLHFDGNYWDTVQNQVVYYEVIYVVKFDSISVCLSQTQPDQFPFISALEVRSLGSNMYGYVDSNYALFLRHRRAFGSDDTVRYHDDPYDRIWLPGRAGTGLKTVPSDAKFINTTLADDAPPQAALQNAHTTTTTTESIVLLPGYPTSPVPLYTNLYFSEVRDAALERSFWFYVNDESYTDSPIVPPYGGVVEINLTNMTANSKTSFVLEATDDSDLPPIINAMEAFDVSDPLTDETNSKDGLYLGGYNLSGSFPDLSSMDALATIDLQDNNIDGAIPDFLGTLPNLGKLNLANNAFTGAIPTSLSENNSLNLTVTGNPGLCSGESCQTGTATGSGSTLLTSSGSGGGPNSSKLPVILGTTIPILVVFWVILGVLC